MTRVAVVAHFLSANIGDRYQGTGLADRLVSAIPGIVVDRINSHPFDSDAAVETVFDVMPVPFDVFNPDRVDYASYDYAIMPTGSIDGESLFVQWGLKLLGSPRLKRLFVWGGFHDITDFSAVNEPTESLKMVFGDPRTYFYARGWLELAVFHMLAGGGRGNCGGDPVLLNDFSTCHSFAPSSEREATIVISGHLFATPSDVKLNSLFEIVSAFPRICYVEGVEDRELIMGLGQEGLMEANTISAYAAVAKSASVIVTQRLHGLAFAKAVSPSLPVILWVPKRMRFSHIKFRSVAESAAGFGLGIAHLWENFKVDDALRVMKNPDSYLSREHEINFAHYVELTERTFRALVEQVAQG